MDREDKRVFEEIAKIINDEKYGIQRFLGATPNIEHDLYSFNGLIEKSFFYKYLYYESEENRNTKIEFYNKLIKKTGANTFFILGYQGCGKTTFINALLEYYANTSENLVNKGYLIDCDKIGIDGEAKPLCIVFRKYILNYIVNNKEIIYNYVDFYNANHLIMRECVTSEKLYNIYNYFLQKIYKRRNFNNVNDVNDLEIFLKSLDVKELLYAYLFLLLSALYNVNNSTNEPIFLFFDNLDYIDNFKELIEFMNAIKAMTIDFSSIFVKLNLQRGIKKTSQTFTEKVKIIIAMRETTYANLPNTHEVDYFSMIYDYYDVTNLYEKNSIVKYRLSCFEASNLLTSSKQKEADLITHVIEDKYTSEIFLPLYNNNYRRVTKILSKIIIDHPTEFITYKKLMNSKKAYLKHGARGIIFKLIMDNFNSDENGEENCLRKIGVLDFQDRKNNSVSIARMILSYLSTTTDTQCNNPRRCVSIKKIVNVFESMFTKESIIESILNMYSLKDTIWTHLISFLRYESSESIKEMIDKNDYKALDLNNTTVHYSCAGKIYLEVMTSHFEFFSTRIKKSQYPALFCESNYKNGSKKFLEIINAVFREVEACCKSLAAHNQKIMSVRKIEDFESYLNSPYVALFVKVDRNGLVCKQKQFHEDRIINSHIGYIDRFRIFIINNANHFELDPIIVNKELCLVISKYVDLLETVFINEYTKEVLLPFYKEKLEDNATAEYRQLNIAIKKDF